jgi:archaellum component FlaF (FlaF/FlaG flagellin family)
MRKLLVLILAVLIVSNINPFISISEAKTKKAEIHHSKKGAGLSNNRYYTNSEDRRVHSPAYSDSVPNGATAECNDRTFSFGENHRGTCSHHSGVKRCLR